MINISVRDKIHVLNIPDKEKNIGFFGDNDVIKKEFFISEEAACDNAIYRLYLTFENGMVNFLTLDTVCVNGGVLLNWVVKREHIFDSGNVTAQIKAFVGKGEVYHTTTDYFVVKPASEQSEYLNKQNSEFLEHEQVLNELVKFVREERTFLPYVGENGNWYIYDSKKGEYIDSGFVSAYKIENPDIRDGAVTTEKLSSGAVIEDKIANGAVTTDKLADKSVTKDKIAYLSVDTFQLADEAVTTKKIYDGAVTEEKIADENITERLIANGAVTTEKIADNTITADKVASSAITKEKLSDKSVTSDKLEDEAVTSDKIKGSAVNTRQIADGAITTNKIYDGAITEDKIADGAIIDRLIARNSVSAEKLKDKSITSAKLVSGSVVTEKIADLSVTNTKLGARAVTSDKIADDAIDKIDLFGMDFVNKYFPMPMNSVSVPGAIQNDTYDSVVESGIYNVGSFAGEREMLVVYKLSTAHVVQMRYTTEKVYFRGIHADTDGEFPTDQWSEWMDLTAAGSAMPADTVTTFTVDYSGTGKMIGNEIREGNSPFTAPEFRGKNLRVLVNNMSDGEFVILENFYYPNWEGTGYGADVQRVTIVPDGAYEPFPVVFYGFVSGGSDSVTMHEINYLDTTNRIDVIESTLDGLEDFLKSI